MPAALALLLSFNHWSYNHGMFFMLRELCNEQVFEALLGCLINCGAAKEKEKAKPAETPETPKTGDSSPAADAENSPPASS